MTDSPPRRRRMADETRHILAGIGVLAVFALLFVLSAGSNSAPLGSYNVTARFDSAEGVYLDSPVRLAGVDIGRVTAMEYHSDTQRAVLTLRIDPGIELPLDSLAIITSEGMLGGRFIKMDPGGEIDLLQDGDEVEYTQGSVMFEELLAKIIISVEQKRLARREAEAGAGADTGGAQGEGAQGEGQ